jgi:hypothetical protein
MDELALILGLAGIASVTTVVIVTTVFVKDIIMKRMSGQSLNQGEIQALREELARIRQTNDAVLSFDASLQRVEDRLARLEQRVALSPGARQEEDPQRLTSRIG